MGQMEQSHMPAPVSRTPYGTALGVMGAKRMTICAIPGRARLDQQTEIKSTVSGSRYSGGTCVLPFEVPMADGY